MREVVASLTEQFDNVFTEDLPGTTFWHYTNDVGLIEIVSKKEFLATNINFLNDASETRYSNELIAWVVDKKLRSGGRKEGAFLEKVAAEVRELNRDFVHGTYVICFSNKRDSLGQWRAYGSPGPGFALGFKSQALFESCTLRHEGYFVRARYEVAEQEKLIDRVLAQGLRLVHEGSSAEAAFRGTVQTLSKILAVMKHGSFAEEEEWRLVLRPENPKVEYFPRRGLPVPSIRMKFSHDEDHATLTDIWHGPAQEPALTKHAIELLLSGQGYRIADKEGAHGVRISGSNIPLRS
jgi:hypothetical protein